MKNTPPNKWLLDSMNVDMDKVLEFIPDEKKAWVRELLEGEYADIITTNHPVVLDTRGGRDVLRWKADPLLAALCDGEMLDLNKIAVGFQQKKLTPDQYLELNRKIGYSLSGYCEVVDSHRDLLGDGERDEDDDGEV